MITGSPSAIRDRETAEPSRSLTDLLRFSPSLAHCLPVFTRAAASDSPILILGESGTGRSTAARAFHSASYRRRRPLVEIDPSSLPTAIFESELFGFARVAFTGTEISMEGRVARAVGGTLVLDHVEELPLQAQPKLLRLLAERRYAPLGGRDQKADVRFFAIAGEDLAERVRHGAFHQDLFYRLEVLAFRLPPLRERLDDLCRRSAMDCSRISASASAATPRGSATVPGSGSPSIPGRATFGRCATSSSAP